MGLFRRIGNLLWRSRLDSDIHAELETHIALRIDEEIARGMTPEEARREAAVRFGNISLIREHVTAANTLLVIDSIWSDVRYAFRQLARNPGFAATAILVLTLGVGASIAIFAFVDSALLEPLPYQHPDRLMSVNESSKESPLWPLSYADFLDWQRMNKSLSALEAYTDAGYLMQSNSGMEPVMGARVSGGFFAALGVRPILGRDFLPIEDRPGGPDVALMSYRTWLHRFGGRRDLVGQGVVLDGRSYTIIGVLPQGFSFAPSGNAEFWTPINHLSQHEQSRTFYNFLGMGRLRDGVTIQAAQTELTTIEQTLQRQYGITDRNLSARVVPLSEQIVGEVRPILLMLLSGAGLLLLIATVNVAGLVLARSESRRREIAVRGALGATSKRLLRQFVTESMVLAGFGCAGGAAFSLILMRGLTRLVPEDMAAGLPFLDSVGINQHTALFAAAIALLTVLLISAAPTLQLAYQKASEGLRSGDHGASGRLWQRLGANLVVVELAVAVVLLTGAGLLGRSLYLLLHVPLGFTPDQLATVQVSAANSSDEQKLALYRELEERISSIPGVEGVGFTSNLPVTNSSPSDRIQIVGKPSQPPRGEVTERHVSSEYLRTLRARLIRGRLFTDAEDDPAAGVALINRELAKRYFGDEDPIGQRIANDEGGRPSEWQIVGVVDDVREGSQAEAIGPVEYFPINQTRDYYFTVVARVSQDPGTVLPTLASTIRQVDRGLGVSDEATMSMQINRTEAALLHKFAAWLIGGFAALALLLGVVGLYGVIAYSVSQRTREIGVRMALGAQRSSVYGLILRQAGWLTAAGIGIGLVGAVFAAALMRTLLFDTKAWDLSTLVAVAVLMAVSALLACFIPARRAASINPVEALRAE